jgi:hypothetical protein
MHIPAPPANQPREQASLQCTSNVFFSGSRHLPLQSEHVSEAGVELPLPWHELQRDVICCTMPGPMGRSCTCVPVPRHTPHSYFLPLLVPTPLHVVHGRLRCSDSFLRGGAFVATYQHVGTWQGG